MNEQGNENGGRDGMGVKMNEVIPDKSFMAQNERET